MRREILPGTAIDGFAYLPGGIVVPIALLTGKGPLPDQGSFEFGCRPEDVK
jgi:hypothetical protein